MNITVVTSKHRPVTTFITVSFQSTTRHFEKEQKVQETYAAFVSILLYRMEARIILHCFNQAFQDNKDTPPIFIARSWIFSNCVSVGCIRPTSL